MAKKKFPYVEPLNYIPEEIRKKAKVGEYAEDANEEQRANDQIRDFVKGKKESK